MAQVYELKAISKKRNREKNECPLTSICLGTLEESDHYQNFQAECSDGCLRRFRNWL